MHGLNILNRLDSYRCHILRQRESEKEENKTQKIFFEE